MTEKSIIHPKFEGTLILISGLHGYGKTTCAATMENPKLTGMIDFDLKGRALAADLGMWYRSPDSQGNADDYNVKELAKWFFQTLTEVPDGVTHLIIDNATWAEAGLAHRVSENPAKYGVNPTNAAKGIYGGVNPGVTKLWANIFTFLQNKGVKVVTAINHMSRPWVDGAPAPNRFNIRGNKVFHQISSLAMVLTPGDVDRGGNPPAPAALVIKEALSLTAFNSTIGTFEVRRALPARIPLATWPMINAYFDKPADFQAAQPGETWTKAEMNAYSAWMSQEQIDWVMKVKSYSEEDDPDVPETTPEKVEPKPEQPKRTPQPGNGGGRIAANPMTQFWAAAKARDDVDGAEILKQAGGDPVAALELLQAAN